MKEENIIGFEWSGEGTQTIQASDAKAQSALEGHFKVATESELEMAMEKSHAAWLAYRNRSGVQKATFLRAIADEIEALGDTLVQRAMAETGLPQGRIEGERGRTTGQLRLFADLVEEGSYVEATIDTDGVNIRKMLVSIGPVVVFTASNFPLAFSTAGGDTASALAAGCPVVVKAHEGHLGTNALVASAIMKAAKSTGMPDGVFSSLVGVGYTIGEQLVQHKLTRAVAFTGSFNGGMALYRLAQNRPEPIPVFAEMGSTNPIFLLPNKVQSSSEELANQIAGSVNLGAGQFCTNPGLIVCAKSDATDSFIATLQKSFGTQQAQIMLHKGISQSYEENRKALLNDPDVHRLSEEGNAAGESGTPTLASTTATAFIKNPMLHKEVFGPFSMIVICDDTQEMLEVAQHLEGQLTATIMGDESELADYHPLINALQVKVGRLIFNGVPTGVAVCHAMQHGGPFPATTDSRFTSVGTSAIKRFGRPLSFQDAPEAILPMVLRENNPLGIWRTVNGDWTK